MVSYWPNQAWLSVLFKMLIDTPVLITSREYLLKLPQYLELVHLGGEKIAIVVSHLEGLLQKAIEFQSMLKTYWKHRSDRQQGKYILGVYSDSQNIAINGLPITFRQPPK